MIPYEQQLDMLERLATEVIPVVRTHVQTTLWSGEDPYGGRPRVRRAHGPRRRGGHRRIPCRLPGLVTVLDRADDQRERRIVLRRPVTRDPDLAMRPQSGFQELRTVTCAEG